MNGDPRRRIDPTDLQARLDRLEDRLDESMEASERRFDAMERDAHMTDSGVAQLREEFSRFRGSAGSDLAIARTQLDKLEPITEDQIRTLARFLENLSRYGRRGVFLLLGAAVGGGAFVEILQKALAGG